MKLFNTLISLVLIVRVSAAPAIPGHGASDALKLSVRNSKVHLGLVARQVTGADGLTLAQIDALTPQFGWTAGINPTGTGTCDGAVDDSTGKPVEIPCDCPPPRDIFIQDMAENIAAGHAVNNTAVAFPFPTDDSVASQLARFNSASITLQNMRGVGVGCPVDSTTFVAQAEALGQPPPVAGPSQSDTPTAPPATSSSLSASATPPPQTSSSSTITAPPSQTSSSGTFDGLTLAQIDALTPQFDWTAGINPDGTGNCDGAVDDSTGKPVRVPCDCPPARDVFIQSLAEDIAAGHAVNNPGASLTFPTDDSTGSRIARIQAALIALQNLDGSGVGCPSESTTFPEQLQELLE